MNTVVNTTMIKGSVDLVYRSCTEVRAWPGIFATVREVTQTRAGPDEVIMDMTVSNDLGDNTVRSHRRYDDANNRIHFTMSTLPPAITKMDGSWTVEPADDGARLEIVHNFEATDDSELGSSELAATLKQTTDRVLAELKVWVEADQELSDLYDEMHASTNKVPAETFVTCELFFSRLLLGGLDWGDIAMVCKDLKKESTHGDWADWHRRWSALGRHYERRAQQCFASGELETGRFATRRAAACYHYAEFFYFDAPAVKNATRQRVTAVFERGMAHLKGNVRRLEIPYEGTVLPGYLMTPEGNGPWPYVILINGLDAAKEVEMHTFANEFMARGMAAVVFDGPGQGVFAGLTPMVTDFENVVAAVLALANRQPEVDPGRVGVFGVSFGGYLAPRAAAAVPGFTACVNLSGGFDLDNYRDINSTVRHDFRFVFGIDDEDEMAEFARRWVNLRDVPPLRVPLLAIHAEQDSIIPFESCQRMLAWAVGETELLSYPGKGHVAPEHFGDYIPYLSDWMAERLGAVAS
ncbi:MAG TPA: alpha/beta hydrolase [Pseudonocardiaceae bacterium]